MHTARNDQRYLWHPFTQMSEWCAENYEPLVIERGEGVYLFDTDGRRYIDGNASIWTNIHGHNHPAINAAIVAQLENIAHSSFLGATHEPGVELAQRLVELFPANSLERVFYTDDGSTAVECALKMAVQYHQLRDEAHRCEFIAFEGGYHGDTVGAAALGGISTFHGRFRGLGMAVRHLAEVRQLGEVDGGTVAAVVIEPLIQGAAGMRLWPGGMLRELRSWCDAHGALLIFDEVMTGFGRTGKMFACQHEGVTPDLLALAKGLTGGYLPLAATLTTQSVYDTFLGGRDRTFYYGHSYCGNPLGCAAGIANLRVFEDESTLDSLTEKIEHLTVALGDLQTSNSRVGEVRQLGLIAGVDLERGDGTLGAEVCLAAREHGLLTRPILDTVVLMPPLSISVAQIDEAVAALSRALH